MHGKGGYVSFGTIFAKDPNDEVRGAVIVLCQLLLKEIFFRSAIDSFAVVLMKENATGNLNQIGMTVLDLSPEIYQSPLTFPSHVIIACDYGLSKPRLDNFIYYGLHV